MIEDNGQAGIPGSETSGAVIPEAIEKTVIPGDTIDQPQFDLENFNKFFESKNGGKFKKFESVDQLDDVFGRYDQYKDVEKVKKDLKTKQDEYDQHLKEVESLYQEANPEKIFGSKEGYKNWLIKKELTKNGEKSEVVIDSILNANLDEFDDLDFVMHSKMLNTPSLKYEEALASIIDDDLKKNPEDFKDADGNEIDITKAADLYKLLKPQESARLKTLAGNAKKELMSIKNTEVPADKNYFTSFQSKREAEKVAKEGNINKLKEAWGNSMDSFKDITTIKYSEKDAEGNDVTYFEFPMDKGFTSKLNDNALDYAISHKLDVTPENIELVKDQLIEWYAGKHRNEIAKAIRSDVETKLKEQFIAQRENRQPFSTKTNQSVPIPDIAKGNIERLRKAGAIR